MSWLKRILNNTVKKNIQASTPRNRVALDCMRSLGFGAVESRQALVGLNRLKVKDLAKVDGVSAVTIYSTLAGRRTSPKAMELIAKSLDLGVEELFPAEESGRPPHSPSVREPQGCIPEALDRQP